MPDRWAADLKYPVEFDERLNEYNLVCKGEIAVMRYCSWCGGRLPESKRGDLLSTPSDDEKEEVRHLLSDAKTTGNVLQLLGVPDETHEWEEGAAGDYDNGVRWKRTLRYSSRWNNLVIDVRELPDGKISYVIFGLHVGTPPDEVPERQSRWRQFWKKRGT